jgi:2-polyprenyl-6-methoxyphenol hydroxylase-like FAD-dependent oxidoreductase
MHAVANRSIETRCCITGGGPAGMMLGVLLARAGVDVLVLEKHGDFLRDFRGDTVHPSTLEVIHELGWLESFLQRPHQQVRELGGYVGDERVLIADFSHLPTRCRFIALMPQWDFLDFLAERGRRYPTFHLQMEAEVVDLLTEDGRVAGVTARTPDGTLDVRAPLTIGADGRSSIVRERAGLAVDELGAPIDVLWTRFARRPDDPGQTFGYLRAGHVFVMLDRRDYWQCAFVIPKGGYDELRRQGLPALRDTIATLVPFLRDRVAELADWDAVKLLTVKIDRLREWQRPGLLCIGDAAHAMSPIGGVGINLAIQDAVAAANRLFRPLREGSVAIDALRNVQRRREFPTRATQRLQVLVQNRVLSRVLAGDTPKRLPLPARLLRDHPFLRRIPARVVGVGFRPEHVRTPDAFPDAWR